MEKSSSFKHPSTSIREDDSKQFISKAEKNRLSNVKYDSNIPSTMTVGGIEEGFVGTMEIKELMFNLLHPYVKPEVELTTSVGATIVFEKGSVINSLTYTAKCKPLSEAISKIEVIINDSIVKTQNFNNGLSEVVSSGEIANVNSDKVIIAKAYDSKGTSVSNTKRMSYVYPMYIGSLTSTTVGSIQAMSKRLVNKSNQSYTFSISNRKMCIATPNGWSINKITDPNGFDMTSSFSKTTIAIPCLDGSNQQYEVLTSASTTQSNFTVQFNI